MKNLRMMSSDIQDDSAVIKTGACWFWGASVTTDDTTDVLLDVYDSDTSTVTGDKRLAHLKCSDETLTVNLILPKPIYCDEGIYAKLDAKEGDYIIYYSE